MTIIQGTLPSQIPTNADLGTAAFNNADNVNIMGGVMYANNKTVTNYFNDTQISNVKPTLLLDFAKAKRLDPRITYTRASTATYYDGKSQALAEQNLCLNSQSFNKTGWNIIRGAITENTHIAPDGTLTASKLYETPYQTSSPILYQNVTTPSGTNFTWSVYAKAAELSFLVLRTSSGSYLTWFNLATGATATVSPQHTASINPAGNGWYRCSITTTFGNNQLDIGSASADGSGLQTGSGNGIYIWGAQLEFRSALSSYTPTGANTVSNYIPQLMTAANNVPRFDHDTITGECKGLLVEEQRTNLLYYASVFNNAIWASSSGATLIPNYAVAPDGTLSAYLFYPNSSGTFKYLRQPSTGAWSGVQTASIYVKYAGQRFLSFLSIAGNATGATFDLVNGTVPFVASDGSSATINLVGNGWYRITFTATAGFFYLYSSDSYGSAATNVTASGFSGVFIWGAQLETGSFATSYIPTTSAQVTRSADVPTMTGTAFSQWFNQAEGTFVVETVGILKAAYPTSISANDNTTNNVLLIQGSSVGTTQQWYAATNGSAQVAMASQSLSLASNKTAAAYKRNDFSYSSQGANPASVSSAALPSVNQLNIGSDRGTSILNGCIRRLTYFPRRLSNAELVELTS